MNQKDLHEKILYPVTRVKAGKAGGSGVLVYSEPDPKEEGKYINIILTCQHVIDGAIKIRDEWDAILKREVKRDVLDEVVIEVFDYDGSKISSANSSQAEIIAYDKGHDLAAIKLRNSRPQEYVASIYPKDSIDDLQLFDDVWTSGCSLLHDPFASKGELTYLREMIDQKSYIMYNAPSIFGNSGGGVFHGNGTLLGLCSRITNIQLGFGIDVMTWMGFGTHPSRLYEFFEHHELQFIYDGSDYYAAQERRKERQRKSLRHLFIEEKDADKVEVLET